LALFEATVDLEFPDKFVSLGTTEEASGTSLAVEVWRSDSLEFLNAGAPTGGTPTPAG
jgi:hypothetical protein